jgi:hypothetical protein
LPCFRTGTVQFETLGIQGLDLYYRLAYAPEINTVFWSKLDNTLSK